MIKYLGSKRKLVHIINDVVTLLPNVTSVVDLFSGTSRVGHRLKQSGYRILANDYNNYALTLGQCYVEANQEDVIKDVQLVLNDLRALPGKPGYFTQTFCVDSRFFQTQNGEKVDAMRDHIETMSLDPLVKSVVLVSLMEAADRVDCTTGLQMAYIKQWAPRAFNDIELRIPDVLSASKNGPCKAHLGDAVEMSKTLSADCFYLDPPYNQHKYNGNYHIWESLVLWDKPEVYGVACKRVDVKTKHSVFNSKKTILPAMKQIFAQSDTRYLVVSFNNEGYISKEDMEEALSLWGDVVVIEIDFKRFVGAQIGIHNPSGKKVGEVSHLRNKEYIYVVSKDSTDLTALRNSIHCTGSTLGL